MTSNRSSRAHAANTLAALSLVVVDRMNSAIEDVATRGPSAPAALAALHEFLDGTSMTQLSSLLGLTHSGTVRLVDRLAADGLVSRGSLNDGRAVSITLTRQGRRLSELVLRARRESMDTTMSQLTMVEVKVLSKLMDKMLTTLTIIRANERSANPNTSPVPWLCRLCDFGDCGREQGNCAVKTAANICVADGI